MIESCQHTNLPFKFDRVIIMFKIKTFPLSWNSETFLFFILLGLTLFSAVFNITFVFGITFTFTSIFIFLLFRLFGLAWAVLAVLLTFLVIPSEFINYGIILLVEIIFVGAFFHLKKRAKMFFVDVFFWLTIGLAALFFLNKPVLTGDALYFQICKDILNGLFNVLFADMLLAYFPFYRLLKTIPLNKNNVSIHQLLSHITIISLMIPFFLIILTKTWTTYEHISHSTNSQAEKTVQQIKREILLLNQNDFVDLSRGQLDGILNEFKLPEYEIIITNYEDHIIAPSSRTKNDFKWHDLFDTKEISDHFYQALPKGKTNVSPINKWRSGNLLYTSQVDSLSIKVFIQYPMSQYQDQIFKEFLIHFRLSVLFFFFTIIIVLVVNRLLMSNLKQLIIVTTGLPQKLSHLEKIKWPQPYISEFRFLTENLKETAQKLKELFQESIEMNRTLTIQTKKLKISEDKLHHLAYYDGLTTLPNRLHFQNYVRELIKNKPAGSFAIIFIDLNQFKQVNDTLGHDAGDALLQVTADKLRLLQDHRREVFRLGGDEFVIVHEVDERLEIHDTLETFREEFSSPITINGQALYISGSVGISMYPEDGSDLDTLVKCADIAMYVSKETVGNTPQFFDKQMKERFQERLTIETSLRSVVDQGGFQLFYQPKIQFGVVTSLEALLRWHDPTLGNVSPSTFIPIAEEIELISKIDEWTLLEACKQNKKWQDEHLLKVPISVNISVKNFQHDNLIFLIEKALQESGLPPKYLKLEITESVFIKDAKRVAKIIQQIKKLGVLISIDDFGKGYSSFIHLLELPIDEIKIDSQFIMGIDQNEKQALLVKSLIDMAHGLNLNIVAEGVETFSERDLLIQAGCDELQGYLFSPPISNNEMKKFLREKTKKSFITKQAALKD